MNFKDNPFLILDASPRDSKRVLHDKAENKSFELPEEICRNAENILLNPKKRLEAELSWFPGISPKKTKELIEQVELDAKNGYYDSVFFWDFEELVYANALALFLSTVSVQNLERECIEEVIKDFCIATNYFDEEEIVTSINEDRIAAGFAEIPADGTLERELQNMQHLYKQILHKFMDQLDSYLIVEVLTSLIEDATNKGEEECEWILLDNIISDYEIDVIPFFEKQEEKIEENIKSMIELMKTNASSEEVQKRFDILKKDVILWDRIAQPVQVLCRSKGSDHERSYLLSDRLRELALQSHNEFGNTTLSIKITDLQQTVFSELRQVFETAASDKKQLQNIMRRRQEEKEAEIARKKALSYYVEWGLIFKKSIKMDADKITINGSETYRFEDMTGVLWGATRNSVNGIPTGTTYNVNFSTKNNYGVSIPIKNDDVYDNVVQRLWKTAGVSILLRFLEKLKGGGCVSIGGINIYDDGVELTHSKWFSSETKRFPWGSIRISAYQGVLTIQAIGSKFNASVGFQSEYNVHVLDTMIRTVLKKANAKKITEAFEGGN